MNTKRLFWNIFYCKPAWAKGRLFALWYVEDMIDGILYAGFTVFGHSIIYSDHWIGK